MGSDTAVTGSGTVPVPGKPQDACCPSRGLQSDLMVGSCCVKGSATPARLEASSCRSPSRYAATAYGTSRACSASQTSSYRGSAAAKATVSASSHPQPSFVAVLVACALATATMSAVLSRPLRARGPLVSPAATRPSAPRTPIASPSALAPIRASMPTPRTRTHALLGGCEHAAHYVLSFWRARVRETSIAFACFCTWPQPTPSASAPMRAREPMCYHHHVHCPITAISGLSASRVRSVVAASVRIRDGHAASSALC